MGKKTEVKLYDETQENQRAGALKTLEIGEWAIMFMKDGELKWFHNHNIATGRIVIPWPWQKDCCDACGAPVPESTRMLVELQRLKIYRDDQEGDDCDD